MSTVYVRWYGNVVQGELLDGETMGMKHVRIPLDGHHPVALFTPQHIFSRLEDVPGKFPAKIPDVSPNSPEIAEKQREISPEQLNIAISQTHPDFQRLHQFKAEHWDQERNHLRIDALDEFYQLYRDYMAMRMGMMYPKKIEKRFEMEVPETCICPTLPPEPPKRIVSDAKMAEIKQKLKKSLKPKKTVKVIQLSLFD